MIKDTNEQADDEILRVRFRMVPSAGSAVPLERVCHLPGIWMCSNCLRVSMEISFHRHDCGS